MSSVMSNYKGFNFFNVPVLSGVLCIVIVAALFLGAYSMSFQEIIGVLLGNVEGSGQYLILNIRLPRILLSAVIGAGLAIAGAAIQGLFRNPLADQSLIGVTGGSMLFAVISIVFMGTWLASVSEILRQASVAFFAFMGGLLTTYGVYFIARKQGRTQVLTMLLAGIAISALTAAITGVFIYISDDQQLRDITFWSLGSFSAANWIQVVITVCIVSSAVYFLLRYAKALNAILLGEHEALFMGISVENVKTRVILLSSLIVGVCIAMCGIIGFVGLIIPHFLRLVHSSDYQYLLRSSALTGAIFLVVSDTIARTIIAPAELPIGILTALVGAPFFLWLIVRSQVKEIAT